jgi:hypothetical protein
MLARSSFRRRLGARNAAVLAHHWVLASTCTSEPACPRLRTRIRSGMRASGLTAVAGVCPANAPPLVACLFRPVPQPRQAPPGSASRRGLAAVPTRRPAARRALASRLPARRPTSRRPGRSRPGPSTSTASPWCVPGGRRRGPIYPSPLWRSLFCVLRVRSRRTCSTNRCHPRARAAGRRARRRATRPATRRAAARTTPRCGSTASPWGSVRQEGAVWEQPSFVGAVWLAAKAVELLRFESDASGRVTGSGRVLGWVTPVVSKAGRRGLREASASPKPLHSRRAGSVQARPRSPRHTYALTCSSLGPPCSRPDVPHPQGPAHRGLCHP